MDPVNLWMHPWKPFLPLVNMSQFIPLVGTIPTVWQIIFAFILLMLLSLYYLFLVIRVNPWRKATSSAKASRPRTHVKRRRQKNQRGRR